MIFIDTSVWIDFFRGRNQEIVEAVSALLDEDKVAIAAPVRIELLCGASPTDQRRLKRLLSALLTVRPNDGTWERMESWIERAASVGERFAASDLLIAALAAEQDAPIWSRDHDFARMESLGFVRRFQPIAM